MNAHLLSPSAPLAIRVDRMFDGLRDQLTERPVVLIEGGRIVAVAERGTRLPAGTRVLELGDVTLMPGFIDTHSHLALDGGLDPAGYLASLSDEDILGQMHKAARRAVLGGVTTVRDLGSPRTLAITLRKRLKAATLPAPDMVVAGPPLTTPAGHGHYLGGAVSGAPAIRAAVRSLLAQGVDLIKVMGSGGRLTPGTDTGSPQFSTAEIRALVDEAHKHDLPVTVHAYPPAAIEQAADAGADGIEHCFFAVNGGLAPDLNVLDAIARQGIVVCPTVGLAPSWPVPPQFQAFLDVFRSVVSLMHSRGVTLVAGIDAAALPGKQHDAVPHAVIELAGLGLTSAEALRAGTATAARACGLAGRKGVIAPGAERRRDRGAREPLAAHSRRGQGLFRRQVRGRGARGVRPAKSRAAGLGPGAPFAHVTR